MLENKKVFNELWKKAGYKEKQKLIGNGRIEFHKESLQKVQDGVYKYKGIEFTYNLIGYENFTIIDS